jgi:hypothetical protein
LIQVFNGLFKVKQALSDGINVLFYACGTKFPPTSRAEGVMQSGDQSLGRLGAVQCLQDINFNEDS